MGPLPVLGEGMTWSVVGSRPVGFPYMYILCVGVPLESIRIGCGLTPGTTGPLVILYLHSVVGHISSLCLGLYTCDWFVRTLRVVGVLPSV